MKKILPLLLAAALILGLTACGSQKETSAAPTEAPQTSVSQTEKPEETTAAPTLPSTPQILPTEATVADTTPAETLPTEAPTEPAVTVPDETEPESTEAVLEADETEVFRAMLENLIPIVKFLNNEEAEALQLVFSASGAVDFKLSYAFADETLEIPIQASGRAEGILDTQKGLHLSASYTENISTLINALMGMESEAVTDGIEMYSDLENGRSYQKTESEGQWYFSEAEESEPLNYSLDDVSPDDLFQEHTFTVTEDGYVFEGTPKLSTFTGNASDDNEILEGLPADALKLTARIEVDREMRLKAIVLEAPAADIDLSETILAGGEAKLNELKIALIVSYEAVEYALPEEVAASAVESKEDGPGEDSHSWASNVFVTDNEILLDNDVCTLKAVSVEDDWMGLKLNFLLENKTDTKLSLTFDALSVNGYNCSVLVYESIDAKESHAFSVTVNEDDLDLIGVSSIDEIRILAEVKDNEKYVLLFNELCCFYPTGLEADEVVYPERKCGEKELIIFENEEIRVIFIDSYYDPFFGFILISYVENNSGMNLQFSYKDVLINDTEFSTYWTRDLASGFRGYFEEYFAIDSIGIEKVEKLSAVLNIKDADDFFSDPIETKEFTFEP